MEQSDEIIIYKSQDGNVKVDVLFSNENVWLTQEQMASLFGKGRSTITEHVGNIFKEGELQEGMVCREFRHTTLHGAIKGKMQEKTVKYYSLDVIISVGYRVKSFLGKNYLNEEEIKMLKLIVEQFLAYAEMQAISHKPMYMKDWIEKLKQVLTMNDKNILEHAGQISHQLALQKANEEYEKFKVFQKQTEHLESIKELEEDIKSLKLSKINTGS